MKRLRDKNNKSSNKIIINISSNHDMVFHLCTQLHSQTLQQTLHWQEEITRKSKRNKQ